jgi:acyl carrier protein
MRPTIESWRGSAEVEPKTEEKLREIFTVVFDLPSDADLAGLSTETRDDWDSLTTLSLVAAVESELGLVLEPEHRERFTSYASVQGLVEDLGE